MSKTLGKTAEKTVPIYKKYAKSLPQNWLDPKSRLKPSDLIKPAINLAADDYPMIVEFNNIQDNTSQIHCAVDVDQPLFQPSPKIMVFENYDPFTIIEKKLFFRNCDAVARRIKVIKPDSPFFEVSAPKNLKGESLQQSKIASGMEVCFIVSFKPQEVRDYQWDLVCSTEREKFIVPIRAVGMRPKLNLPDEIDFGFCPVKSPARKTLLIQNLGSTVARITMTPSSPEFSCPDEEISIDSGSSQSIELFFTPTTNGIVAGEFVVVINKDVVCHISLTGEGKNVEVSLSTPSITLEPSYISMASQKTLKIRNSSDQPISYVWKSFANIDEEDEERDRLLMEINRMETMEHAALRQRILEGAYQLDSEFEEKNGLGSYDDSQYGSGTVEIPFAAKADEASLIRKYRNLRKALEKDSMQFVDDIFEISPIEGQVWAHSELEVTISFKPDTAAEYHCLSFLDVSGRHDRLPLQINGLGIGPHAALSLDVLDIGDIFINDEQFYEISIKNKGDIPAQWTFLSSLTKFGNKFRFSPTEGYLLPNQSQAISIRFESDILGEFSEHFRFSLQGNEDMLLCQIKGHVIGPTFHFDTTTIDFGTVSFDYLHSTTLKLVNTAKIPMVFNLHIPQDGTYLKKEFNIEPSRGTLSPGEDIEVLLEFIPSSAKTYDYSLAVDVLGVGDVLLSIPIVASCVVSSVGLEMREIDFGDCFIRYPYERDLKLTNLSTVVHTKFEISPQSKHTMAVASYETEPSVAVIEPGDSIVIKIRLVGQKLGPFKVPLVVNIVGSQEPPLQGVLAFNTIGPKVTVGANEIRWGNIECLKDSTRVLSITNEGLITAAMKVFLKMAKSCYAIDARELILDAGQSYDLQITANLDDSIVNKDEIHIVVNEGDNLMVPLSAKGIGTTMYCKHDINVMDLEEQLTNIYFEKQIVLENKGRRPQQLRWMNKTLADVNAERLAKAKLLGKGAGQKPPKNLLPAEPIITVAPEEITLRPRTATTFTFRGFSAVPKIVSEVFILESKVGKDRFWKPIVETEVKVSIVNPLLKFSVSSLAYVYVWEKDVEALIQKKPLTLTNEASVSLTFVLKTEIPFNLNSWEHTLAPGESVDLLVEFDPLYKDDLTSHTVEKSLSVFYRGHPQKDSIPLFGEVIFPNLKFDLSSVAFGCVLNDTTKVVKMKATNWSKIDVNYHWIFFEQTAKNKARTSSINAIVPANQVFDILPIKSTIRPGESEDVEFSMFGTANNKFNGKVICVVEGGPEYKFPISGEASTVGFELNRSIIDFGKVVFTDKAEEELVITNKGKVTFNYEVVPGSSGAAELFEIVPSSGKVSANQTAKIIVRVKPGIPATVAEPIVVRVAHFDPVEIQCYFQGIFPTAVVHLPRMRKIGPYGELEGVDKTMWENFTAMVVNNLMFPDPKTLPPPEVLRPQPASGSTANPPVYVSPNYPPVPPDEDGDVASLAQSLGSSTKGLPQIAVEVEMQRLVLCKLLNDKLKRALAKDGIAMETVTDSTQPVGLQSLIVKHVELNSIVAASYLCDLGNVIIGQTRKKIFKITNASLVGQLNWSFDRKFINAIGFSIEPEKVVKLPESSAVDFTVKFFARTQQKTGVKTAVLPLQSKGSPTINLILSANVCLPEIELSSYVVDFGKVLLGRSSKVYIRLHNTSPVVTNWSFKKTASRDEGRFTLEPSEGSLRPGRKMIVAVEFLPLDAHRCHAEVALKIQDNKKSKFLKLLGEGFQPAVKFEPNTLTMGPVLPYFDGDVQTVSIQNTSEMPIEIYAADFDNMYKEEDEVLSAINEYDSHGIIRTNIRTAGQPLPVELIQAYETHKLQNITTSDGEMPPPAEEVGSAKNTVFYEEAPIRTIEAPRDTNSHQDIVFIGAPLTGVTSNAAIYSKKFNLPLKTIDEMVEEVTLTSHPLGQRARQLTGKSSPEEMQLIKDEEEKLLAIAEQSKAEAVEAYKKEKKGKAKEIPPEVYDTEQVRIYLEYMQSLKPSAKTFSELIEFRLTWSDVGYGIVVDGLQSRFMSEADILQTIKTAIPRAIYANLTVNRGEEGYAAWLKHVYDTKNEELENLYRSLEYNRKLSVKSAVPRSRGRSQTSSAVVSVVSGTQDFASPNGDIEDVTPTGDEPWYNNETGLINELESQDFKMLEEKEKSIYLKQILYQQTLKIREIEELLPKISLVWQPEIGLIQPKGEEIVAEGEVPKSDVTSVDVENAIESEKNASHTVVITPKARYYSDYMRIILPLVEALPKLGEEVVPPAVAVETSVADSENDEKVSSEPIETANDAENQSGLNLPDDVAPVRVLTDFGRVDINLEGDESENVVYSTVVALLPAPKVILEKDALPPVETYQIFRKPIQRMVKKPVRNFEIVHVDYFPPALPSEEVPPVEEASTKGKKQTKGVVEEAPKEVEVAKPPPPLFRWIIQPNSEVQFKVKFRSLKEGKFESGLEFVVVGTNQRFNLLCSGICELPKINNDTRNFFMKRAKAVNPTAALPQRRFVIQDNFYSFGPLLTFKRNEWLKELSDNSTEEERNNLALLETTNMDTIRLSNIGKFKLRAELCFENTAEAVRDVFKVEKNEIELEEGETKEVKVYAFPKEVEEYQNKLLVLIDGNPCPIEFAMKCWGVKPSVEIVGPWVDGLKQAENALAANTDKKLVKDLEAKLAELKDALTLDFDRILIGKSDTRSYTIKNTSLLPVAFQVDPGDFKDSENVSIYPLSGVIPINTTETIMVTFSSPEPLMLTGKFSLKYSDNENGLEASDRCIVNNFRVVAEAYKIQAVSFTADDQEDGGSSIDFGLIRVGDYAVQVMKMGNKGKYEIGYKFELGNHIMAQLVQIEPMEGKIPFGNTLAEIKVTFCCKDRELLLKNNKEITVHISEPTTGEIVETFPLFISAQVKYNKFRIQPSKGMQFGAVRFDAEAKTKRVELRNEGSFELMYVICPAIAEHDEIDSLDNVAFASYAYATPAALRAGELGDGYLSRVGGGGDASGKDKKGKAPPKKGKGAVEESNSSTLNPLVKDPDNLVLGTLPTDSLVVGAFSILPRIAIVQPGQSVAIDMKFDPAGGASARERLRVCISCADPSDALTKTIGSFELTGESCIPAIINGDVHSIFEEQEIVHSLADSTGENSAEGGGKIEKLQVGKVVYAETEKMLAFGPVSCGQAGRGVVERIRISNPTKIDSKVRFKIVSPEEAAELAAESKAAASGGKDTKGKGKDAKAAKPTKGKGAAIEEAVPSVFTVQPVNWEIPPHEHRFVSIYFNPLEIKSYRSIFIAEIDDITETTATASIPNSGKSLIFDLAGSGTMPCISFDSPSQRDEVGNLILDFGRVLVSKLLRKKLVIRNDGVMPATCLFDIQGDKDFQFSGSNASLTVQPGEKGELFVTYAPQQGEGDFTAKIKVSVLNNQFDQYSILLKGSAFVCDAIIDSSKDPESAEFVEDSQSGEEEVTFPELNLADGPATSSSSFILRSNSDLPIKFDIRPGDQIPVGVVSCSPATGHLAAGSTREITLTFSCSSPLTLSQAVVLCELKKIEYKRDPTLEEGVEEDLSLRGLWDDSMKSIRLATEEDVAVINAANAAMKEYTSKVEAEKKKGKKAKPVGPPPPRCLLELCPLEEGGQQKLYEIVPEPYNEVSQDKPQQLELKCSGIADVAKYSCEGEGDNILFRPTYLFQSTTHKITFRNECNIKLPISWDFDDIKRRATTRGSLQSRLGTSTTKATVASSPFFIEPQDIIVPANSQQEFSVKFNPVDVDDFVYLMKGETLPSLIKNSEGKEDSAMTTQHIRVILRGMAKRPVCHFDIVETLDYLTRRPANMKNENGLNSNIEATDLKVVELESVGLRTRNTFRFYITNPTSDNYEFIFETMGDPSPFWRCVQSAGMMYSGKRIEIIFEYLPEETAVAESFYKFKLPKLGLEQIFLFTGKVSEPKVLFTTSRIDFHSVMLGGEGGIETVYLENKEHLPFNFAFDKLGLLQLESSNGPVVDINPKFGTVAPHGRTAITFAFHPQEEVVYNFNIACDVKRKPNKLSINVKGEGYAVHPVIQLEQSENEGGAVITKYQQLKPHPAINYADFGAVQVLDSVSKSLTVLNNGKFNFDYAWDISSMSSMLTLTGGRMGGTLLKGDTLEYKVTFAPNREDSLDGSMIVFTVAGKYVYNIFPRGNSVKPALRFSFLHHDFDNCFITSPGGSTVVEEKVLQLVNNDPTNNISIECTFQKTRALWADCPPTVIPPGGTLEVPIRFAPRDVKDYAFVVPFVVNGTGKVPVNITGKGITARLELVNGSQRRTNFGLINVGTEVSRSVAIINRSKKALPVQLSEEGEYGGGALKDRCVFYAPKNEFLIGPKEVVPLQLTFAPNKRVGQFHEDLIVKYAGISRKLINLSGKAQGVEVSLDTDSIPFGVVVLESQKVKKVSLENTGDIGVTYHWMKDTMGKHFSITPLSGKLLPGNETTFNVVFKPLHLDDDIRQDDITLMIPGLNPLKITCTGSCITPPSEAIQTLEFKSLARKANVTTVSISNPSEKDWYLSPTLQGSHWKVPHEFKVPAKGSYDLAVTYFPLSMTKDGINHSGQLFIALPDGSAKMYKLVGNAGEPECAGNLTLETAAKKPATINLKVVNWVGESQKLDVSVEILEKPSPATFIVAANATDLAPNGTKEFPIRFISYVEGNSRARITFTNTSTGEYCYYDLTAKTTMAEVLEIITIESPVRQTARYNITVENPLPIDMPVTLGSVAKPTETWTCDSPYIKLNELSPIAGNTEGSFEVEYRPLKPTEQPLEHLLTIITKELGTFKYKVVVKATPPMLRQTLRFDVPLGSMQTDYFVFKAYNTTKCDYTCSSTKPDFFIVQKTLTVEPVSSWEGEDIRLPVMFEPGVIGEVKDTLKLTSSEGEYVCELVGTCSPPLPQGPFDFLQGSGAKDIPFRNCFTANCNWTFSIDSTAFRVGAPTATVNAKTEGKCTVFFEPKDEHMAAPGSVVTAKLFITCSSIPNIPPWVFYLKGKVDPNAGASGGKSKGKK